MATEQITEVQSPTSVVADDDIEVHAAADDYSEMEVESSAQSNAEVSLKDDSEIRDVGSTSRTDDAQSEAPSAVTAGRTSKPYDPRPAVDRKKVNSKEYQYNFFRFVHSCCELVCKCRVTAIWTRLISHTLACNLAQNSCYILGKIRILTCLN